jgi:hypothetical protein
MPVILATQEAETERIMIRSQPKQILQETLSQKKKPSQNRAGGVAQGEGPEFKSQYWGKKAFEAAGCWWLMPLILVTWETEVRKISIQGQPRHIVWKTPISKITRAKWTRGVAQMVGLLLCKCEALS